MKKKNVGGKFILDGLGFDFTHWREYAVHWVHDVHHKFSYGARLKYLYGMENFTTDVSYMGIETDQNTHALKFDMAFDFRTSGLPQVMVDGDIPAIGGLNTNDSLMMQQSFSLNPLFFKWDTSTYSHCDFLQICFTGKLVK